MNRMFSAFAAALLAAVPAFSQDIPDIILKANASVRNVECKFQQLKTIKASGKKIASEGVLYFNADGRMSMNYSKPATDLLVINGQRFHLNRSGKASTFDISKNQMMASLAGTLTGCIKGDPAKVAADNGVSLSAVETTEGYVVTLAADVTGRRGYSKIVLTYRKSDCMLVKMVMEEPAGISTVYQMSEIRRNTSFPEDVFRIPGQ